MWLLSTHNWNDLGHLNLWVWLAGFCPDILHRDWTVHCFAFLILFITTFITTLPKLSQFVFPTNFSPSASFLLFYLLFWPGSIKKSNHISDGQSNSFRILDLISECWLFWAAILLISTGSFLYTEFSLHIFYLSFILVLEDPKRHFIIFTKALL